MALELREAPRVAVDLLRRRRRHALGLLLLSRGAAAREAAREGLLSPERRPWDQASRGADEEARDRHLFHFHGVANKNLRLRVDKFAGESSGLTLRGCVRRELCERTAGSQSPGRYYGCREQQNSRFGPRWMR